MNRCWPSLALSLALPASLAAQSVPRSLGECTAAVAAVARTPVPTSEAFHRRVALAADSARACVAHVAVESLPDSSLLELTALYMAANDTAAAASTVARYASPQSLPATEQAARLVRSVPVVLGEGLPPGIALAERIVAQLDALPSATAEQKIAAHGTLLGEYRGDDVDDQIEKHAGHILQLLPALTAAQRTALAQPVILAHTALAEVYGGRAQADSAIALLRQGQTTLADVPRALQVFDPVISRYQLVGHPGAPILGDRWLNGPAKGTRFAPAGAVTLVEFSAHWCGPCRKSYDAITRLHDRYTAKGMRSVLVTSVYGFFQGRQNLTPDEEIAADSQYFFVEHRLPVQVAIAPAIQTADAAAPGSNLANYQVTGIPQIVVLDRAGTVRMIVIGWDPASEARIATMIDRLLAESMSSTPTHAAPSA